jgi:molecular chaperone DnaK
VHVLQGEREMAKDNRTLGRFHLVGIPAAPRGVPQIEVSFDIDANGILKVSAKDKGTGKEQNITITGSGGLSDNEIKEMVTDAEGHADEDRERRKKVEAHNRLVQMIYATEKTFEETKDKLSTEDKGAIESLTGLSHKMAEKIYQQTGGDPGAGPGESQEATAEEDDEVIDAEYVDVGEQE